MKTKKIMALLLAVMMLGLTACGGSDDSSSSDTSDSTSEDTAADTSADTSEDTSEEDAAEGLGYVFEYNGVSVVIDAEAADILEGLGEEKSYYEAASCAFDGLDKIYTYDSFEIDTYPTDDVDYISAVILKDDLVSTAEGVAIGDSQDDVTAAYGEGTEEDGYLVYYKDDMKLRFIIEDGVVTSIEYQTTVMD